MSKGIKILIAVIVAILVLISAFVIAISNTKMPQIEPCDLSALSELEVPDSRIIAIGTPTHGNAEPIKLTLEILKQIYREYGSVAFILEEVAGDADIINNQHSYTKEDGSKVGMYLVYDNNEISDILNWLEQTNQRFYGIDIQSISETSKILSERLADLNFSDAERILSLPVNNGKLIEQNRPFLDTIAKFVDEQMSTGRISEQERDYLLHLLDCIKMNYEYVLSGYSFDVRDKLMARNVEWIMDYEQSYFNNDRAVLFASNGHVMKANWSYSFSKDIYVPMGTILSEKFNEDYFVLLTDARENYFEAGTNMKNAAHKKVFHIKNDQLDSVAADNNISIIKSDDWNLDDNNNNWKLVIIGSIFTNFRSLRDAYYTTQISPEESCNMIICFGLMTPVQNTD